MDEEIADAVVALQNHVMDLAVSVNMIASVMPRYPEEVQENFAEKIADTCAELRKVTKEFQDFGEAWDSEVERNDDA